MKPINPTAPQLTYKVGPVNSLGHGYLLVDHCDKVCKKSQVQQLHARTQTITTLIGTFTGPGEHAHLIIIKYSILKNFAAIYFLFKTQN